MIVTKIKGLKVNYYKVEQVENNLNELKCFEYYRDEGYNVYIDYLFYFKYGRLKEEENIIKVPKHKTDNKVRIELVRKNPKFKKEIFKLFKKYDDGFPDLLIEKDNIWKFVEVKTTSDSLRPNQLEFIGQLKELWDTSIDYFITDKNNIIVKPEIKVRDSLLPFKNKLKQLDLKRRKRNYKEWWLPANIIKYFPNITFTEEHYKLIASYCSLKPSSIKWYVENNRKEIIEKATKRACKKKNKMVKYDEELIKAYSRIKK
jgi:hypothetical protein